MCFGCCFFLGPCRGTRDGLVATIGVGAGDGILRPKWLICDALFRPGLVSRRGGRLVHRCTPLSTLCLVSCVLLVSFYF